MTDLAIIFGCAFVWLLAGGIGTGYLAAKKTGMSNGTATAAVLLGPITLGMVIGGMIGK